MQKSLYTLLFLLTAAAAGAPQMPERSLDRKGNRQYNKGNYEKSIERYERALEAAPESFEATYNLGNALYKAERFDRAEQTMQLGAADALRARLYFGITYWGQTVGIRVEADIRAALFGHMQELGFEFFDRNRTGQLMSRMTTELFEITELAHLGPEDLFISFVTIVGALAVMATLEWRQTLVVAVMIPEFILVSI